MSQTSGGSSRGDDPPVTVSLTRRVKPGREEEYEEVSKGAISAASRFPGHLGADAFRPQGPDDREYRVVFKFDRESSLRRWMESEERERWLRRAQDLAEERSRTRTVTGLEAWFSLPSRKSEAIVSPPRDKMALVTWFATFPLTTVLFVLLEPLLLELPLVPRMALLTALLVALLTWVVMPRVTRLFGRWLHPPAGGAPGGGRGPTSTAGTDDL